MNVGSRVYHSRLGRGIIIKFCKYGGVLVNYSNKDGVLVRACHVSSLEVIHE